MLNYQLTPAPDNPLYLVIKIHNRLDPDTPQLLGLKKEHDTSLLFHLYPCIGQGTVICPIY